MAATQVSNAQKKQLSIPGELSCKYGMVQRRIRPLTNAYQRLPSALLVTIRLQTLTTFVLIHLEAALFL